MISVLFCSRVKDNPASDLKRLLDSAADCVRPEERDQIEFLIKYDDDDDQRPADSFFDRYPFAVRRFVWSRGEGRHSLHHAQEYIRQQLSPSGLGPEQPRIAFVSSIEDAVRTADLAIDCVPDELESKLEILWLLDRMAPPRTVLATPTTRLSIADLAACTHRPDKCVAIVAEPRELAHGLATEILLRTTVRTSAETVALVRDFWRELGVTARFETDVESRQAAINAGEVD